MPSARRGKANADPVSDVGIGYRLGLAASHRGEQTALETLNTALEAFLAQGDVKGAALASAALLITNQVIGNYRRFPEHIERLAVTRDPNFAWRNHDEELVALTGLLAGLIFFGPDDPFLEPCVERTMMLLGLDIVPGGNAAKLDYYDGASRKTIDIAKGLSIEAGTPDRIRGQLQTEVEKIAFDLHFDLSTVSSCQVDAYRCGPDAAP
jgi:hypothetical protein